MSCDQTLANPIVARPSIVLASGSPRRLDLLRTLGWDPLVVTPDVDETIFPNESPAVYVDRLARRKAESVVSGIDLAGDDLAGDDLAGDDLAGDDLAGDDPSVGVVVIAADTCVEVDGAVLGKPVDEAEATEMITRLSGRDHLVHTGVAVIDRMGGEHVVVTTRVTFAELRPDRIAWYVGLGESLDKAGGYAIQGAGAALIERIDGSPSNVIGLPLAETVRLVTARVGRTP